MSRKISAPNIISGTHGKVWWDDSVIYEISSFEATLDTDREDVTFAGDMIKDSKLMSVSGTFTMKVRKVFSRGKRFAEAFMQGKDPRSTLISQLKDPDAYGGGYEKIQLTNCWVESVPLTGGENGKVVEEEYKGGFTGLKFLESIEPIEQD